ncbi:MAG: hypothetical protein A4E19_09365 [Nitrospira sp. SG-bin1]|nr:MAG: hypothetical protein A4E19_09365 [Nitrospira sp. SG-bin1]
MKLVQEFTYQVIATQPRVIGPGTHGTRQYYELTGGTVKGPRLNGKLVGTGGDYMLAGQDGYLNMDVRVQMKTDDGALIYIRYHGPVEANEKLQQAAAASGQTAFEDQRIRSYWVLETGDPRYLWVNRTVFVGEGRLLSGGPGLLGMEHRVYRLD